MSLMSKWIVPIAIGIILTRNIILSPYGGDDADEDDVA